MFFTGLFARSVAQGASTQTFLSIAPGIEERTGQYFDECEPADVHAEVENDELCERVWEWTERMIETAKQSAAGSETTAEDDVQEESVAADVQSAEDDGAVEAE